MQGHQSLGGVSRGSLSRLLGKRPPISQIKQIHGRIITQSPDSSGVSLTDSLIHCYLQAGDLSSGRALFNSYPSPSPPALLWNLLIRAYSKIRGSSEPVALFRKMLGTPTAPDEYTFNFVITSFAHKEAVVCGRIFHGFVIRNGFLLNLHVANSLISMYAISADVEDAHKVFNEMPEWDVFAWTSLVSAYAKNGNMMRADEIFRRMPERNRVSWAAMISGFVSCGCYSEALRYFHEMLSLVRPNEAALVCALSACANLRSLDQGKWIHDYIDKNYISKTSNIMTALIDMYAKCGEIDRSYQVFDKIPTRDAQNFTCMISGLSIHGLGEKALSIFQQMLAEKLKPNDITILGVLNGCKHSGLLQQGSLIFYNMENLWGIVPKIEHYGCYVDLLGRAGFLAKALGIIRSMPLNPDIVIWRSLLSSCRIHRNINFGERVIDHLHQLEPRNCSRANVLLSNMYASYGKWEKVVQVRDIMGNLDKKRSDIGVSWIEVNGVVHEFRVADKIHPQIVEIREKLDEIIKRVRSVGYSADVTIVSFDLSDEDREEAVAWHSEKLAVAFGLMSTGPMDSIRIAKNLRTCDDCHTALKAISRVYDREIIVRDRSRFHTFREGKCSCGDYW